MALFVLSLCPFDIPVGVGAFVIGLGQISAFLSSFFSTILPLLRQCWHIFDPCTCMAQVKSGEEYPSKIACFRLNKIYMKIQTPNLQCTNGGTFFWFFFLRFVVWPNNGHFWGVYKSNYFAFEGAFPFSFVYVMYRNNMEFYGKQIKSKLGNKSYFLNDFHLCTLESALSAWMSYNDP